LSTTCSSVETLGFAVTPLAARVRHRTAVVLPRTHMLLLVRADGIDWLTDVGFGGEGLLLPVPLRRAEPCRQFAWTYRLIEHGGGWLLQSLRDDEWIDLYAFTLEQQEMADYEMANHYVSTHPNSRFVQTRLSSRARTCGTSSGPRADPARSTVTTRTIAATSSCWRLWQPPFDLTPMPPGTGLLRPGPG
jgi:N-hydroxyarylamine O-acetyltransferase